MKKLVFLLTLSLFVSGSALAAADPTPNGIGIYFDPNATSNCSNAAVYTSVNAYLIATNLTQGGLSGWEATLLVNPTTFPAGLTLDIGGGALNVLTAPVFQVGLSPSRFGPNVTLLTITTFYLGGPIVLGIAPCQPSSFQGTNPGYADPYAPEILVKLTPASNVPWTLPIYMGSNPGPISTANGFVVAGVNASPCPVAVENSTWGGVKDLYK
jgi:hypothetical protein